MRMIFKDELKITSLLPFTIWGLGTDEHVKYSVLTRKLQLIMPLVTALFLAAEYIEGKSG